MGLPLRLEVEILGAGGRAAPDISTRPQAGEPKAGEGVVTAVQDESAQAAEGFARARGARNYRYRRR
jgi:hypothetical protein